jgi:serine/threonine protein kinase
MQPPPDSSRPRDESPWLETVRFARAHQATPLMSIVAGRPVASADLVRRVLERARTRIATARPAAAADADYLLGELLGAGGMGRVFAATQVSLERTVAVKVLRQELVSDERARDGFFAEAFVTAELDHPNTVPIYEIGLTDEGAPFYAMKLVSGSKWSTILASNSLEENLHILLMVCDVVTFAHHKGIIHRDLKPENVMLGPFGEVLLLDWGLAASVGNSRAQRLTRETVFAGTPAYMAPEVACCDLNRIGTASDVYLLGGMLYEIVTGMPPHDGPDLYDCLDAARKNLLPPTDKSGELLDIARRALQFDPPARYASVKEFAAAIRDALTHIDSFVFYDEGRRRFEELPGLDRDEVYRECHEIIALFQRALAHWPGNIRAAEGLIRVRDTLSAVALRRGEIQLARSQVRARDQECEMYKLRDLAADNVAEKILSSLADRARQGRIQVGGA